MIGFGRSAFRRQTVKIPPHPPHLLSSSFLRFKKAHLIDSLLYFKEHRSQIGHLDTACGFSVNPIPRAQCEPAHG